MKVEITEEQFQTAKNNGISRNNVKNRIRIRGYSVEEAITLPVGTRRNQIGKIPLFTDEEVKRARFNGIPKSLLYSRYERLGYTKEEAIDMPLGARRKKKGED